jgi:hypothetical protein
MIPDARAPGKYLSSGIDGLFLPEGRTSCSLWVGKYPNHPPFKHLPMGWSIQAGKDFSKAGQL